MTLSPTPVHRAALRRARPPLRVAGYSAVLRIRMVLVAAALLALLLVLFAVHISTGDYAIPLDRVLEVFSGSGSRAQRFIILENRLPRALTAVVVGAALGLAGAITQSVLRNPLAGPDILGITSGASVAAVALITLTGTAGAARTVGVPLAALIGGLLTAILIYLLAWGRTADSGDSGVPGLRLVLIGIGVNAALLAAVSWLLARASLDDAAHAQRWLTGSLNESEWATLIPAALGLTSALLVTLADARGLAALRFGSDTTRVLGVRVQAQQTLLLAAAVGTTALATAAAGPLAFVGLAAPQIARRLLRSPGEPVIASALFGAVLVLGADLAARTVLPVDLPVGVVTAACGGPFLLYLLVRTNRKATL
ncbi:iron chelate uptake ABC transporter family permease subunit [Nocardia sp. CC227C]|uniref:FecCD family ABC transporter permease n=1 Tax=Nocardia sp. CC227C TaxID=3044562 RepID=UPI00278BAF92|nr:iron chelate uptake ABC transporter family permease subunit [Nocardia sp. CC227C]